MNQTKRCITCHQEKPIEEFIKDRRNKDGRRGDCRDCNRAMKRRLYGAGREPYYQMQARQLRLNYDLSQEEFDEMFYSQLGRCACCGQPFKSRRSTHVDHCHLTEEVRGLLCLGCNISLGGINDDPSRAELLARYLHARSPAG